MFYRVVAFQCLFASIFQQGCQAFMKKINPTDPLTLNLDATEGDGYRQLIVAIRRMAGSPVLQLLPEGGFQIVDNLTQSAHINTIPGVDWLFLVTLTYQGLILEILLQRFKLYLVGYRATNGGWIIFNGEYPDRVEKCLDASSVFNKHNLGKRKTEHGTSYLSLKNWTGEAREHLILNQQTLRNAVLSLNMPFDERTSAIHVLNLIQMIPEAVRIEEILCKISSNYFENDSRTPTLSASCIKKQGKWTWASRMITFWTYGMTADILRANKRLPHDPCLVEELIARLIATYPYIRGVTLDELLYD